MTQDQEGPYSIVKAHYDATVSELENQIASLQQEKEELASLLAQGVRDSNQLPTPRCVTHVTEEAFSFNPWMQNK
ncbi:hypothetical protein OUZ56_021299 [Daphnia magna]|uniref:Uncharacterized protein n=1 Tax=Daphnia magna TaxID=35525 RepID=A0ABQ9ZH11_9CRUS|nr:hypothetical protein OUZ56_021299 [Daphnia magna]